MNLALLTSKPFPWVGKTNVFAGDSITFGERASFSAKRWTTLLSILKGSAETNLGISGQVLQNGSVCGNTIFDQTTIPTHTGSHLYLFLALGVNDININHASMTAAGYQTKLSTVVDYAVATKGWAYSNIVIVSPYYITNYTAYVPACSNAGAGGNITRHEQYVTAAKDVSIAKSTKYADAYTAMKNSASPSSLLSDDFVHPNDVGYKFIADFIQTVVR